MGRPLKAQIDSPNPAIDRAIKKLMDAINEDTMMPDVKVKVINSAIAWEKVKHQISDAESGGVWDPEAEFGTEDPFQ
jgi:hypothetical protein